MLLECVVEECWGVPIIYRNPWQSEVEVRRMLSDQDCEENKSTQARFYAGVLRYQCVRLVGIGRAGSLQTTVSITAQRARERRTQPKYLTIRRGCRWPIIKFGLFMWVLSQAFHTLPTSQMMIQGMMWQPEVEAWCRAA